MLDCSIDVGLVDLMTVVELYVCNSGLNREQCAKAARGRERESVCVCVCVCVVHTNSSLLTLPIKNDMKSISIEVGATS
jgi:hypothetical protein